MLEPLSFILYVAAVDDKMKEIRFSDSINVTVAGPPVRLKSNFTPIYETKKAIFVEWRIESISIFGEVKVTFTSLLDKPKINLDLFNRTGFDFLVLPNQEYTEMLKDQGIPLLRDLKISFVNVTEIGLGYMKFKLQFSLVPEISKGGARLEDLLFVTFPEPDLLFFLPETVTDTIT